MSFAMVERRTEWAGLEPGDVITIAGEKGTRYSFIDAEYRDGECVAVNCIGGKVGVRKTDPKTGKKTSTATRALRSFRPERVKVPNDKDLAKQRELRRLREDEDY